MAYVEWKIIMESINEPQVIGGMFGLEGITEVNYSAPTFMHEQNLLLVNARSGFRILAEMLLPSQIWMPSYICDVMLQAVNCRNVRFYEVNYDLAITSLDWLEDIEPGDLVILIDYFGFPFDSSVATLLKEKGAWVLEDASQALLTGQVGLSSDFVLFSPRKFLGVPDGGVLMCKQKIKDGDIELDSPPAIWWLNALKASILRRDFDRYGTSRHWVDLFNKTEAEQPIGHYAMSDFSQMLLKYVFDYAVISQRRVENYNILAESLARIALYPTLSDQVVPLGFPIRVEDRKNVQQALFEHEIFPPIHWPVQNIVPDEFKESHRLAAEIMTLPCDQRYDGSHMEQIAELICRKLTK
jgi:dTDP-4-amino-4,6-dideoxygalactose transaminase